jgi:lysophospholipid acyltransferase (LPLAT)-like uncharacterized protein
LKIEVEGWPGRGLIVVGFWLLWVWARTLRYVVEDRGELSDRPANDAAIGAAWHNRLLILPMVLRRFLPKRRGAALISASRDGAWIAELVKRVGFDVVRGSSSRQGVTAVMQMGDVLASGSDVVIAPDGPRGPVYQLGAGIIYLAQKSGAPVYPINIEYSSYWRVESWDRFFLPRPFAKARIIFGPPHQVGPTTTEEEFETERLRLQDAMMSLVEER